MKSEEMKRFEKDLRENKDLQAKFEEKLKAAAINGAKSDGEAMTVAAKSLGYTFSIAELEKASAETQELSDDELQYVSGGECERRTDEYDHDAWCATVWHCLMVTLHTESSSKEEMCWSDFCCVVSYICPNSDDAFSEYEAKK